MTQQTNLTLVSTVPHRHDCRLYYVPHHTPNVRFPPPHILNTRSNRHMNFVQCTPQAQKWDLDALDHLKRMQRLDHFREEILSDVARGGGGDRGGKIRSRSSRDSNTEGDSLLLDLSPERLGTAARVVKSRRKAATEALKGAQVALRNIREWKRQVLAERETVSTFLREFDPALAFSPGPSCNGGGDNGDSGGRVKDGRKTGGEESIHYRAEADVVICDPRLAEDEDELGNNRGYAGTLRVDSKGVLSAGTLAPREGRDADDEDDASSRQVGFSRAHAALIPGARALQEAEAVAGSGDRLSAALDTLREHVKATLIDLMDLETSLPGNAGDDDDDDDDDNNGGIEGEIRDPQGGGAAAAVALSPEGATSLDLKIGGLVRRLSGDARVDDDGPPSLANLYSEGLGGAAAASEAEVDATESLTARALAVMIEATAGPFLSALDNAYQVCVLCMLCQAYHICFYSLQELTGCRKGHAGGMLESETLRYTLFGMCPTCTLGVTSYIHERDLPGSVLLVHLRLSVKAHP